MEEEIRARLSADLATVIVAAAEMHETTRELFAHAEQVCVRIEQSRPHGRPVLLTKTRTASRAA